MVRPSKYCKEIVEFAEKYVRGEFNTINKEHVPTHQGLVEYLGGRGYPLARSSAYGWMHHEDKQDWRDVMDFIMAKQMRLLINKALTKKFNPTVAKLLLNAHGISQKTAMEISGIGGGPVEKKVVVIIKTVEVKRDGTETLVKEEHTFADQTKEVVFERETTFDIAA